MVGVVIAASVCCTAVFGLAAEHRAGAPGPTNPHWPQGLNELVKGHKIVRGFFINANDYLFYSGDTEQFNEFLKGYAAIKDTPLTLVIHAGRGKTGGELGAKRQIAFDWQLGISRQRPHRDAAEAADRKASPYVVSLNLWLGGQVELNQVEVPLNVTVKSGGEIEKFIAEHEERRKEAQ
jgi:hypothetical protein